ncbi:hypothetical protein FRC08_008709 [Ceratobasidium sp. 394]|nr:hypothetical protein FRC08_008709 [Ceratobasidium sp. 394]
MSQPLNINSGLLLKVIGISELANQIFCLLDNKDLASLAHLSRLAFECVIPAQWEVVDVKPLLILVPGASIFRDKVNSAYEHVLRVREDSDLSRFNVYAPHIKHLRGTPQYTIEFTTRDNSTFGSGLLPSLQRITLVSRRHDDHGDLGTIFVPIGVDWVSHFLSPSLINFEMFGVYVDQSAAYAADDFLPWMDRTTCLRLVGEMSDRCPRMETLQMFPEESSDDFSLPYAELAKMRHLRSFAWSGHRVDQGLMEALGALPQLESLRFLSNIAETPDYYSDLSDLGDEDDPYYYVASDPITISGGSFPALQNLELASLGLQIIATFCALGPLFQGLTSLKVAYEIYSSLGPYSHDNRTWSEDVFALLGGSPHLPDLEISNLSSLELTVVIERLRQMPLRRLSLPRV